MALLDFNLGDIGGVFKDIREAITGEAITDPDKKLEIEAKLKELEHAANMGQIQTNIQEASHKSIFVAGWRPAVGWVCAIAVAYSFIGHPLIEWYVSIKGIDIEAPKIDNYLLFQLLMAMLGFGGLRTYEKLNGKAKDSLRD